MMDKAVHNKLVRDNIPAIIEKSGRQPVCRTLTDGELARELDKKLVEETGEYLESHDPGELADILEVVYALASRQGISPQRLEALRAEKAAIRGGFTRGVLLYEVLPEDRENE